VRLAKALYSTSEMDLDIVDCFFEFLGISELSKNTANHVAQSLSAKPLEG